MSSVVLDTSAIIAAIRKEPGAALVNAVIDDSVVSTVNVAEVVTYFADQGYSEQAVRSFIAEKPFERAPFDQEQAWKAGMLRPITRHLGLSLGDRACLTLAATMGLPVMTADRVWAGLSIGVEVQLIR